MTVAEEARDAVRARPFLFDALRAGVVNYTAAAESLDVDAETDAVATALRRYAADLQADADAADAGRDARVTMRSGVAAAPDAADPLLAVGGTGFVADGGDLTAVLAAGDADPRTLERALGRLRTAEVDVTAAGVADGALCVVVGRRDGAGAVRCIEAALE
ncbi:DUF7523 family protein [Halobaculum sp. D14]|uniref:DUF7523 family protein n=1 Tax=unclassified Halobaculum TaxID=2640896 RepID=UPI003EB69ABD